MNYRIQIPRKTFNGLCAYLQHWGRIYSVPGAVVLKGMLRQERAKRVRVAGAVLQQRDGLGDASAIALRFNTACNGLGRCKVTSEEAILDLRDLSEEEQDALLFVSKVAALKPQQTQVMERFKRALVEWEKLPAMMRIALAAQD
jgi:hypothetical protein